MNALAEPPLKPSSATSLRTKIAVRRSAVHGRGVFATRGLFRGELICEYKGERISWDEAIRRHPHDLDNPDHTFYFDVGDGTVIDGAVGGNSARWLNHSCSPNCEAEDHDGRILIRTLRAVLPGEELSIDYALAVDGRHTQPLRQRYACRCGSPDCRGTMLAKRRKRSTRAKAIPPGTVSSAHTTTTANAEISVRVFERPNADVLIVPWREAGRCCYSEQRWERTEASATDVCALTGDAIAPGQPVFRPIGNPAPLNQGARIAESSVRNVVETQGVLA
jgi:hypothetical protein